MLDKSRLYMVINYGRSPVCVASRTQSMKIPGSDGKTPAEQPLSLDEIIEINSLGGAFKLGLLRFEEEYEEEIYDLLRIRDWRSILTDEQIEDILLHPTLETLQKIVDIKDQLTFDRVRGIYTGLKSVAADVPGKVDTVINERAREFARKITTSRIQLVPKKDESSEVEALKEQMAKMQEQMAALAAEKQQTPVNTLDIVQTAEGVADTTSPEAVTTEASSEPKPKSTTKKKTAAKKK
ncbi:MAG: hypothetical protein IJG15_03940 [Lachnospiraceae bacterium]|nr:hypothetical protein [Lachnospiraceae bacterium]